MSRNTTTPSLALTLIARIAQERGTTLYKLDRAYRVAKRRAALGDEQARDMHEDFLVLDHELQLVAWIEDPIELAQASDNLLDALAVAVIDAAILRG